MGGLLLILGGALGMVLLLGFIALRLLGAALFSLFYLLIAPGMVLAPALGEGGRALFRRWAGQLLAAVVSKLLFSFLLGVVLAVLGDPGEPARARLVDAVAADVGVLVGCLPSSPPGARCRTGGVLRARARRLDGASHARSQSA